MTAAGDDDDEGRRYSLYDWIVPCCCMMNSR